MGVSTPARAEGGYAEQEGHHGANTFTNYHNASGMGPAVGALSWVNVSCKVYDPTITSVAPDGYWYRISSSPWNDQYYAAANTFMNGDPLNGPYTHNTDFNVPDCGSAPPPGAPAPVTGSVSLSQGPVHGSGYRYAISLSGWGGGASVSVSCRDSADAGGFYTFTMYADGNGNASTSNQCYSGDGPDHWVVANGAESNHVSWGAAPVNGGGNQGITGSSGDSGGQSDTGSSGSVGPSYPQPKYSDPCLDVYGPGTTSTHASTQLFGGTETDYDWNASQYQVCEGFGSGSADFSTEMKCAAIAALTTMTAPPEVNLPTHDVCDALGRADAMMTGDWANELKGEACTFIFDTLGEGAGIAAAGATVETGPAAKWIGVYTYRALSATGSIVCGAFFDNGAHDLGAWMETSHEAAIAHDVETKGECIHMRSVWGQTFWSAAPC